MTRHAAHSVVHSPDPLVGVTPTIVGGLTNLSQQLNATVDNEVTVGSPFPQFAVVRGQKPQIGFASRDAAGLLGLTGSTGVGITADDPFVAYYAKIDEETGEYAASGHRSYTADKGLLLPRSLSCQHQQDVQVEASAMLFSDGATAPLTISDAVATLPTISQDNKRWTLGTITLCGAVFPICQQVQVDFGNNVDTEGSNSNVWDTMIRKQGQQATITLTGLDASIFAGTGIPMEGKASTHANTTIRFRKYDPSGILFVDNATTEHITLTADGIAMVQQHNAQGYDRGDISVQLTCRWDGTNAPIVIATGVALSA